MQKLQGGIIMKKKAIISVISSAMLITSAAASVYASAASISPVPSPVSGVQMTMAVTDPTYPTVLPYFDEEDFTIPGYSAPTGTTEPPTNEDGTPYVYEPEKIFVYYMPDWQMCSLDYWLSNYPEEAKEPTKLIVRYQLTNMDEIREECDKAGRFMRDSEDPYFLKKTE